MKNTIFSVQSLKKPCFEYPNQSRKIYIETSLLSYTLKKNLGVIDVKFAYMAECLMIYCLSSILTVSSHFEYFKSFH